MIKGIINFLKDFLIGKIELYDYLFAARTYYNSEVSWIRLLICRYKGHPNGVIWNSNGMEPNMHCKDCGDNLG